MMVEMVKDWAMRVSDKGIAVSAILVLVLVGFGYMIHLDSSRDETREERMLAAMQKSQNDLMDQVVDTLKAIKENVNRNTSFLQTNKARIDDLVPLLHELMAELRNARRELPGRGGKLKRKKP